MKKRALLIITKNAEAGRVKTRLAATIGNEAALAVFHQLQRHTVLVTASLPVEKFVFYSRFIETDDEWPAAHFGKQLQQGDDLGQRMKNAFAFVWEKGYAEAVIIGTDCPGISAGIIMDAFAALGAPDVVIGPAEDGGYYLLGMTKAHSFLFDDIPWSTGTVLNSTIQKCMEANLQHVLLPVLSDVDTADDWKAVKWKWQ